MPKSNELDHIELVRKGLKHHEAFRYEKALGFFDRALELCPTCPIARYDRANTLHCLDRDEEARPIFAVLAEASDQELREECPDFIESPRSMRLDSSYMLFLTTLYATGSWEQSVGFAETHLRNRARGLRSLFSRKDVVDQIESLRIQFAATPNP